jgi:hypothetical protein
MLAPFLNFATEIKNIKTMAVELRTIPAVNPGTSLKFRLTITKDDFTLADDKWNIVIKNNLGRTVYRLTKNDCYHDTEGNWYFNIMQPQVGTYTAIFVGAYEDEDYDESKRIWTDRQVLFVCRDGCMMRQCLQHHPASCPVHYEQVWNKDGYLADCYGRYIYTADGNRIQFTNELTQDIEELGSVKLKMTGEEFLQLIEGRNPDGKIDTLPEMMDAARGISDGDTIKDEIDAAVEGKQDTLTFASDNTCETIVDDLGDV